MDWSVILPAALAGMASGVVGSLIAPWVHWAIKQHEERRNYRRALIDEVRNMSEQDQDFSTFKSSFLYLQIKPHLSRDLVSKIESYRRNPILVVYNDGIGKVKTPWEEVRFELSRLERKWKLI